MEPSQLPPPAPGSPKQVAGVQARTPVLLGELALETVLLGIAGGGLASCSTMGCFLAGGSPLAALHPTKHFFLN